ncbi:hypothetical protein [Polaribacter sp. Hel1_85]|uniref:hypothetical protein n=1 Tax=Polaribacter sp. Hel1_85 TaxID=1250005 RepID=UPI00052D3851|nr:hypothetical protein [Polaribacter sp. Hel1_85]KGL64113.1 hypothetical protein PHEL85_1164 [Polaribacter sp. Hel1_85]
MKIKLLLLAVVFCYNTQVFTQQSTKQTKTNIINNDETVKTRKNGLNISFGTSGFGVGYARKLTTKLNAIVAYHSLTVEDKEVDISEFLDNDDVEFLGSANSTIIDAGIEYVPFKNSSFKLAFGVGFLNDVAINGLITYKEGIEYGDIIVASEDVGKVIINSKWSGTAPFLGFGFGRAIPKNRFGFGVDIGTYFAKSPEVSLQADKLLTPTQDEQEDLQDAFESLTLIPRIQFRLTYNF